MDSEEQKNEEPIVSGSLDDSATEEVELNNNEGSDMGENTEEAPLFGPKKSEPVVSPAPSAEPVATPVAAAPKKKSHVGLIITIIVLVLVLVGGGLAAFFWMMWHESAEVAINDAMTKTFEVKDKTISGTLKTTGNTGVKITFDGVQSDGNLGGSGKISFAGLVDFKFDTAVMKGGDLYLKLDGIEDAIKNLPIDEMLGGLMGGSSTSGMNIGDMISKLVSPIAEVIDGEWIKISSKDLKSLTSESSCDFEDALGIFSGDSVTKELADAYKNNAFIIQTKDTEVEEKDGVKYYTVELDGDKVTAFSKAVKDTDFGKKLSQCSNKSESDDGTFVPNKDTKIRLGIKPWSHELVAVEIKSNSEQTGGLEADLALGYEKKSVEEPSSAKTVDQLKSKIEAAVKKGYKNYLSEYAKSICQSTYGAYGSTYVNMCITQVKGSLEKEVDDFKLEDILGNLAGGGLGL